MVGSTAPVHLVRRSSSQAGPDQVCWRADHLCGMVWVSMHPQFRPKFPAMEANRAFASRQLDRMRRAIIRSFAFVIAGAPALLLAQYSEIHMGEYLHYAVAAANGGV